MAVFIISWSISLFLIPKILLISVKKKLLDPIDKRKIHRVRASRLGGVAFFPSITVSVCVVIGLCLLFDRSIINTGDFCFLLFTGAACFAQYILGLTDDMMDLRYRIKFAVQFSAAFLITISGICISNLYGLFGITHIPGVIGIPLTMLLIVFIINAINLIDGINGLASGLSIIALTLFGVTFCIQQAVLPAVLSFATVGALAAFFRYNVFGVRRKSTRIFMGDSGTLVIGTLVASLAVMTFSGKQDVPPEKAVFNLFMAYSALIVPCFDVLRVMLHRYKKNQPMFQPDKCHIHHKFLALGFSQKKTLLILLGLSTGFIALNSLLYPILPVGIILFLDVFLWTGMNILMTKRIKTHIKKTVSVETNKIKP